MLDPEQVKDMNPQDLQYLTYCEIHNLNERIETHKDERNKKFDKIDIKFEEFKKQLNEFGYIASQVKEHFNDAKFWRKFIVGTLVASLTNFGAWIWFTSALNQRVISNTECLAEEVRPYCDEFKEFKSKYENILEGRYVCNK